jgi:hypothetical protein
MEALIKIWIKLLISIGTIHKLVQALIKFLSIHKICKILVKVKSFLIYINVKIMELNKAQDKLEVFKIQVKELIWLTILMDWILLLLALI